MYDCTTSLYWRVIHVPNWSSFLYWSTSGYWNASAFTLHPPNGYFTLLEGKRMPIFDECVRFEAFWWKVNKILRKMSKASELIRRALPLLVIQPINQLNIFSMNWKTPTESPWPGKKDDVQNSLISTCHPTKYDPWLFAHYWQNVCFRDALICVPRKAHSESFNF